jgi:hypothetical protein
MKKIISFLMVMCALVLIFSVPAAQAQIDAKDPMVRITSLPLGLDVNQIMVKLSDDVSKDTGIAKNMITYYWQTFDAVYCPSAKEPEKAKIIFVDLYAPGFMTDKQVGEVMVSLANSLEKHTKISKELVFIQAHVGKAEHVYISGKMAKWSDFIGEKKETRETKETKEVPVSDKK